MNKEKMRGKYDRRNMRHTKKRYESIIINILEEE